MQLQIGDRLTDETGEYEIIGPQYTTQMGTNVHVRVKRVDIISRARRALSSDGTLILCRRAHRRETLDKLRRRSAGAKEDTDVVS